MVPVSGACVMGIMPVVLRCTKNKTVTDMNSCCSAVLSITNVHIFA